MSIIKVSGFKIFRKYRKANLLSEFVQNNKVRAIFFDHWKSVEKINVENIFQEMNLKNPCCIPRNHLIEDALKHAVNGDMAEINLMTKLLQEPFIEKDTYEKYTMPSPSDERYVTYCVT